MQRDHEQLGGGLATSQAGYTLELKQRTLEVDREALLSFRILDRESRTLTAFDEAHERRMHVLVARRDLAHYVHLHPEAGPTGEWSTKVRLPSAGVYLFIADFRTDGKSYVLGTEVFVAGPFDPAMPGEPRDRAQAGEYDVQLRGGPHEPSGHELTFVVERAGRRIEDLQPYLGALGHLAAFREGDFGAAPCAPTADPRLTVRGDVSRGRSEPG